jgi:hypothetical protein
MQGQHWFPQAFQVALELSTAVGNVSLFLAIRSLILSKSFSAISSGVWHANHEEVLVVLVRVLPGTVVRIVVDAVDASVRPEVDKYQPSFLIGQLEQSQRSHQSCIAQRWPAGYY